MTDVILVLFEGECDAECKHFIEYIFLINLIGGKHAFRMVNFKRFDRS